MCEERKHVSNTLSNDDDDDDDEYNECLLNPNNDRRVIVCDSPNKADGIIECIGSIESQYIPDNKLGQTEKTHGTGTVIHIDNENNIYILSAAHNILAPKKRCNKCNVTTLKKTCPECKGKTSKTGELVKPTHMYFDRRGIDENTSGKIMQRYKITKYEHRLEYETFCTPKGGYDICILICKCKDNDGINIYRSHCPNICLINDETFGGGKCALYLYGYPGEKRKEVDYRVYYYLFGMGTSVININIMDSTNKFQVSKNKKTNKLFIINKGIDTTGGQSGSLIYGYNGNNECKYLVYGIHAGGSFTQRANYGTFFDIENIEWVATHIMMNVSNIEWIACANSNKFIVCHYGLVISKMKKQQKSTDMQQIMDKELKKQIHKLEDQNSKLKQKQQEMQDKNFKLQIKVQEMENQLRENLELLTKVERLQQQTDHEQTTSQDMKKQSVQKEEMKKIEELEEKNTNDDDTKIETKEKEKEKDLIVSKGETKVLVSGSHTFNKIIIEENGVLTTTKWIRNENNESNECGGVLILKAQSIDLKSKATLHVNELGYKGGNNGGYQGESVNSKGNKNNEVNKGGGGGGMRDYGGGGGYGTKGSDGNGFKGGKGGNMYGDKTIDIPYLGSGGGGGNYYSGGAGGGYIRINAIILTIETDASIQANGQEGTGYLGGGGGSGGSIYIKAKTIKNCGSITALGGKGNSGGGSGGAGRIRIDTTDIDKIGGTIKPNVSYSEKY